MMMTTAVPQKESHSDPLTEAASVGGTGFFKPILCRGNRERLFQRKYALERAGSALVHILLILHVTGFGGSDLMLFE